MWGIPQKWLWRGAAVLVLGAVAAGTWVYAASQPVPGNAQWYAQASEIDPIFAIDGTDPAALRAAVDDFLAQANVMAEAYNGTAEQKSGIHRLYPRHFLTLLPQLQAARVALLSNPTPASATHYHNLLMSTIQAYVDDAHAVSLVLASLGNTGRIVFVTGASTGAFMAEQMAEASDAATLQARAETQRFDCYRAYDPSSCRITTPTISYSQTTAQAPDANTVLVDTLVNQIIRHAYPDAQHFSPFIALSTACFPYATTYSRGFDYTLPTGNARKAYVANDAWFYDIGRLASSTEDRVDRGAYAAGVNWEYQNITNGYMCPDIGLYYGDLTRALSMMSLAQASSSPAATRLREARYITLADAAAYARAAGDPMTRNLYREGSWNFDQLVQGLIKDNDYVLLSERSHSIMQYSYLMTVRNYASVLFLFNNPTFLAGQPSLLSGVVLPNNGLLSWNNQLSKTMTPEEILAQAKRAIDYVYTIPDR